MEGANMRHPALQVGGGDYGASHNEPRGPKDRWNGAISGGAHGDTQHCWKNFKSGSVDTMSVQRYMGDPGVDKKVRSRWRKGAGMYRVVVPGLDSKGMVHFLRVKGVVGSYAKLMFCARVYFRVCPAGQSMRRNLS